MVQITYVVSVAFAVAVVAFVVVVVVVVVLLYFHLFMLDRKNYFISKDHLHPIQVSG